MSMVGTHGDIATHTGTCQTCGREGVGLKTNWDRRREEWHFTCVDQFSCFDTWRAALGPAPTPDDAEGKG